MRIFKVLIGTVGLLVLQQTGTAAEGTTGVPDSCPVTRSTPETRFTPSLPAHARASGETMFWYGSDLTIGEVYPGATHSDTCISEIYFVGFSGPKE